MHAVGIAAGMKFVLYPSSNHFILKSSIIRLSLLPFPSRFLSILIHSPASLPNCNSLIHTRTLPLSPTLSPHSHTPLSRSLSLSLSIYTSPPLSPYSISSTPFFTNTHSLSPNSFSPPTHSSLYPQLSLSLFQLHTTSLPSSLSPNSLTPSLPTQSSPLYPLTDHLFPHSLAPSLRI